VIGEEVPEVGVVVQRSAGVELVPDRVAAGLPGVLDVRGLGRLNASLFLVSWDCLVGG
jgi:hypothetical protein